MRIPGYREGRFGALPGAARGLMAAHADSNVALDATGSEAAEHVERGVTVEAVGDARAVRGQSDADDRDVVAHEARPGAGTKRVSRLCPYLAVRLD
jgi:hypothetical protein